MGQFKGICGAAALKETQGTYAGNLSSLKSLPDRLFIGLKVYIAGIKPGPRH